MRIGNILDASKSDAKVTGQIPANYSKADTKRQINVDIAGIGKDTNFFIDRGRSIDQGRSIQDVKSMAGALDVQTTQDYMTVMSNTMSGEDYLQMNKDGFDPADMTGEESSTILDHIKAVMAESGQIIAGYNDNLDRETLIGITGSAANANSIINAMKQADIAVTEENAKNISKAAERLEQIEKLGENAIAYMIENHMPPTIDNIYKANFSASETMSGTGGYYALDMNGYLAKKSDASGKDMIADIQAVIDRFGIDEIEIEEQIKDAQWLIEKDLNVTEENIIALNEFKQIVFPMDTEKAYKAAAIAIKEGKAAEAANLLPDYEDVYSKAARIYKETNNISDTAVENVVNSGERLDLKNLSAAQKAIIIEQDNGSVNFTAVESNISAENAKLTLQEVRLQMTLDINVSLLKKGMAIDTMPLTELVEEMKQESSKSQTLFLGEEAELSQKASLFKETRQVVSDIPFLPAAVIGRLKVEEQYSLFDVHKVGTDIKTRYEAAGQTYEALMTAPRRDLGDSISKAFQNVDDILADLGMEAVEENRKAVRILGYNNMAISEQSVNRISEEMQRVMQVVNDLTPAKTLELIRQNVNPLDMKLEELSYKLSTMDVDKRDEKYASFLYKLEKSGEISQEERTSYIGIYRLMNRLEKTDGAAIGAMINQNRDITFRSLLSGMRSSKVNMDVSIDDNFGFLDKIVKNGASITDQIEAAFEQEHSNTSDYLEEKYQEYQNNLTTDSSAADSLEQYQIPVTLNNMVAYNALSDKQDSVFKKLDGFSKGSDTDRVEQFISSFDSIIDNFESRDTALSSYEDLQEAVKGYIEYLQDYEANSYIDLKALSLCNKQIKLAGNLARNEEYVIPMYAEDELTTVKLTLKHGGNEKGRIDISYGNEKYGEIAVHLSMEETQVKGLVICDSKLGQDKIKNVVEQLEQKGYSCNINIIVGKENQRSSYDFQTNTDINNVDTKSLYKLAKEFIKAGI